MKILLSLDNHGNADKFYFMYFIKILFLQNVRLFFYVFVELRITVVIGFSTIAAIIMVL